MNVKAAASRQGFELRGGAYREFLEHASGRRYAIAILLDGCIVEHVSPSM